MNFVKIISGYFFVILLAYGSVCAQALELKFERIGREQGLTAGSVLSILQDGQGFMWFGTEDGLFRYDGYGMTVYKYDPLDSTTLGNNNVFALLEDRSGTLWLGTAGGGLNRFDRATERFTRFKHDPHHPNSLSADVVSALFEDRSGVIWVGTWTGLNQLEPQTGRITRFMHHPDDPGSMNPHWIRSICQDSLGDIWVGTDGGISRLDRNRGQFTHFVEDRKSPGSLSSNGVNSIIKDRSGTIWIGGWGGLDRFEHKPQRFTNFPAGSVFMSLFEDRAGVLWIGTQEHLLQFDKERNRFTRFVHDPGNPYSQSSDLIQTIYEDRTGAIWIGTQNGVNRLDREQYRFKQIVHDPNDANSLSHKMVGAIHEGPTGALWIATAEGTAIGADIGLNKLDRATGRVYHSFPGLEREEIQKGIGINCLYEDRSGILWIGTGLGLGRYDPEQGKFKRYVHDPEDPHSLSGNQVAQIHEDQSGRLWVAVHNYGTTGIDRFDHEQERFLRIELAPEISSGQNQKNGVSSISEGQSGRLWFSTMGEGIFVLNPDSDGFIQFNHESGNPNSLSHTWVGPVHEDRKGMVWAAPWYGGLNRLDPESGRVTIFTEKDGLSSNYISSITEDDYGRLWLTTKNGLSRFDPLTETFKNFDRDDGLLNSDFDSRYLSLKSRTGEVFFGGVNGINFVHPDSIRDNPHIPPVVFTRFTRYNTADSGGRFIIEKGISEKRRLDLSYQDQTLTFEFAALNFRNPENNQYVYKLEGFSDHWINLGNKHEVTFTNLDPGEYTLRVKGANNDGIWNEAGASLVINISPPWWQTGWAYSLFALFALGLLYGLRRYELNRQRLRYHLEMKDVEAKNLQELDHLKSRFFAGISHEFRTPLTLISGPVKQLLSGEFKGNIQEQYRMILRNCNRLLRLVNQLLDLSKLESGKITLQAYPQDIVSLTRQLTMTFESLASVRDIELQFTGPEEPVKVYLERQHYEKIIINLLSNAFKFTPDGGKIQVAVAVGSSIPPGTGESAQRGIRDAWSVERRARSEMSSSIHPESIREASRIKDFVEIRVGDTGIGIPAEDLPHIFNRFYQAGDAHADTPGSGIGLALTKELVELHHGEIRVVSEVGKGSIFIVRLPLGKAHLNAEFGIRNAELDEEVIHLDTDKSTRSASSRDSQVPSHSALRTPHSAIVLIVEDNPDMRAYIRDFLMQFYDVVEAADGEEGLAKAAKTHPDMIISDVMMPNMDGFQFCEKIKTDPRTSHIPVILLTARASGESKIEGLETGADDYLTKPFDAKELRVRISNLIEQRRKLRERFRREIIVQPGDITVTSIDEKFLQRAISIVEANISESDFNIDQFCSKIGMSRRTLNRKLRALTGLSTNEFIRLLRLKRAGQLLRNKSATIVEIAYQVGFNNPSYFAECFRKQFGKSPSEYAST